MSSEQDILSMESSTLPPHNLSAVESKFATGRSKKDAGDAAFKNGDIKGGVPVSRNFEHFTDPCGNSTPGVP
ncbi:hypothetical protein V8B97DRAFT_1957805 [Scleroderma yunnanense]